MLPRLPPVHGPHVIVKEIDEFFGKRVTPFREGSFFVDALASHGNLVQHRLTYRIHLLRVDLVGYVRVAGVRASEPLSGQQDAEGSQEFRSSHHRVVCVVYIDTPRTSFDILNDLNGKCGKETPLYGERH